MTCKTCGSPSENHNCTEYLRGRVRELEEAKGMQEISYNDKGVIRFKTNHVIRELLKSSTLDLNDIACMDFSVEDMEQFYQLLGYSVSGYGDVSFVRDETIARADRIADKLLSNKE